MLELLAFLVVLSFPAAMAFAAVSDLLTMTIPNRVSLLLVGGFFVAAPLAGLGWQETGAHLLVGGAVLAVTFTLFAFNCLGGGDAKIAAAAALWLGPAVVLPFLVYTAVFGGLLAMTFIAFRAVPLPVVALRESWVQRLHTPGNGVPYGIALTAGALVVFPDSPWFAAVEAVLVR